MNTLIFDGQTGAAGDMIVGTLIDIGGDPALLTPVESALPIEISIEQTTKQGIAATEVTVRTNSEPSRRSYSEVRTIIKDMDLPDDVISDAVAIFERLAQAEASIHGSPVEDIHFHEVGADDAIVDIVGASILMNSLDPDQILVTPIHAGDGETSFSHGTYPVPSPAVVEISQEASWELQSGPIEEELLTPTGAAILAHFGQGTSSIPPINIEQVGYGAGTMEFDTRPNVLRAITGQTTGNLTKEGVTVLETNVDDVSPEVLGSLQQTLTETGAKDVSIIPMSMKKSRPGHLIKVITAPSDAHRVAKQLITETGTLGVRINHANHRWIAQREIQTVTISLEGTEYSLPVKIACDSDGNRLDVSAEFDDAADIATEVSIPTREIIQRAESAFIENEDATNKTN